MHNHHSPVLDMYVNVIFASERVFPVIPHLYITFVFNGDLALVTYVSVRTEKNSRRALAGNKAGCVQTLFLAMAMV
jgi:hypothetical protein